MSEIKDNGVDLFCFKCGEKVPDENIINKEGLNLCLKCADNLLRRGV